MPADWILIPLDLLLVVAVARCGGWLAVRAGQPRIAGELVALVAIGPTVLGGQIDGVVDGAVAAGAVGDVFPAVAVDVLTWIGGLGLILYMLLVGMTIDPAPMARRAASIAGLGAATLVATGALTVAAAIWLRSHGGWRGPSAGATTFALALGAALSAHGLPVVARILEERGLLRTEVGGVVIAAGALVTTVALVVSGVAIKGGDAAAAARLVAILAAAAALLALVVAITRSRRVRLAPWATVVLALGCAVGAGVAGKGLIGSALVGPLVIGVLISSSGRSATVIDRRLGALVRGALLPIFLAVAALHTDLRELRPEVLAPVVVLLLSVTAVKLASGYLAARAGGFQAADARAIAALLQCGGIMTIAISLDALDAGVISTRTHAALTLIGLLTTVITGPLLGWARRRPRPLAAATVA